MKVSLRIGVFLMPALRLCLKRKTDESAKNGHFTVVNIELKDPGDPIRGKITACVGMGGFYPPLSSAYFSE